MRIFLSVAATVLAASTAFAQSSLTINTPSNAVVCQPLLLSWSGGTGPYYLLGSSLHPFRGSDPSGQALEDLGQQTGNSYTWNVNIAAGTQIGLTLRDTSGLVAQTAPFTINPGSDSSCVGKPVSSSGSSGTTTPATSGSSGSSGTSTSTPATSSLPTTSQPATSPATTRATGTTSASGSTTGTRTSASSTVTRSNAASAKVINVGTAGIFGAALVALLA
ncbi:hypothetical protein AX15_004601 [Amanita polypyramis BW_CC]|nr:hypothetical protein AX15_004601 [Amanita polypyramis BW_CC]